VRKNLKTDLFSNIFVNVELNQIKAILSQKDKKPTINTKGLGTIYFLMNPTILKHLITIPNGGLKEKVPTRIEGRLNYKRVYYDLILMIIMIFGIQHKFCRLSLIYLTGYKGIYSRPEA
jgi:hypothetical protein